MNLGIQATGTIHSIKDLYEGDTWRSIRFTLRVENDRNPDYPHYMEFELGNKPDSEYDNAGDFAKYRKIGDEISVEANVTGNVWQKGDKPEMTFNKLKAWKIEKADNEEPEQDEEEPEEAPSFPDDEDDVPF